MVAARESIAERACSWARVSPGTDQKRGPHPNGVPLVQEGRGRRSDCFAGESASAPSGEADNAERRTVPKSLLPPVPSVMIYQPLSDGDESSSGEYHEYGEDEPNECHAAAGELDIPEGPEDECGFEMFVSGRVFG